MMKQIKLQIDQHVLYSNLETLIKPWTTFKKAVIAMLSIVTKTYAKHPGENWPVEMFAEYAVKLPGGESSQEVGDLMIKHPY